ncbi:MAG: 4Fe-4S binding protein [Anaerolineae bacterium]|nr:4Fe-4S binding protein [Anaerolineae bacterium]MCB9132161.1 4Fe-4S binding protein [Anaerolineales bacterium]MCB0229136.1 4Fe-4S binding protein [Anaerolineae bacterium]MCB0237731.1 4Fe-4S binding protein [Anaerolineae bacterium]MCB0242499.1 4Fe-4S binding protein [Anaerolineae bacterium]
MANVKETRLAADTIWSTTRTMDPLPTIDQALCTGCHRCVEICPTRALDQRKGKAFMRFPDLCTYCTVCEDICPANAIALPFLIVLAPGLPSPRSIAGER